MGGNVRLADSKNDIHNTVLCLQTPPYASLGCSHWSIGIVGEGAGRSSFDSQILLVAGEMNLTLGHVMFSELPLLGVQDILFIPLFDKRF